MGVSIIIGGQWGSEGKGKVTHFFSKELNASSVIRVGGANSGHTVIDDRGQKHVFQILPVASIIKDVTCILPAGSYIDLDILDKEIAQSGISDSYLRINPNAMIVTDEHKKEEKNASLNGSIGSTESGTGAAVRARICRNKNTLLAKNVKTLEKYLCDTNDFVRQEIDNKKELIIEGTQGFGLSLLHSPEYPYATSRDTSAAGFLSECGLSPCDVTNIIMVLRAFPIRVAGNSGPLPCELTWEDISKIAKASDSIIEYTTVTKKVRRVARFDHTIVHKAITVNKPNIIVLNHCDFFDISIQNKPYLSDTAKNEVKQIENSIGKIDFIGTGDRTLFKR
jgi:adenylosuccinate synthase